MSREYLVGKKSSELENKYFFDERSIEYQNYSKLNIRWIIKRSRVIRISCCTRIDAIFTPCGTEIVLQEGRDQFEKKIVHSVHRVSAKAMKIKRTRWNFFDEQFLPRARGKFDSKNSFPRSPRIVDFQDRVEERTKVTQLLLPRYELEHWLRNDIWYNATK